MKILVNIVRIIFLLASIFFVVIFAVCVIDFLLHGERQRVNKILLFDLAVIIVITGTVWSIAQAAYKAL